VKTRNDNLTSSEEDFDNLFEDMDLNRTNLGRTAEQRNEVIVKVLSPLDKIDSQLEQTEIYFLGSRAGKSIPATC
jgi:type I restriction enzyme M protein